MNFRLFFLVGVLRFSMAWWCFGHFDSELWVFHVLCFVVIASLWLHEASWRCSRNPLISGEDTPKISQHGFSDGKTWHCNTELWFFFWLLNLVWRCVLLLWQVYDCMKPHDGVVVIRWSLVKILQKLASMDFLMARHGIATWICVFFLAFEFGLTLCFVVMASLWLHEASWWCSRNPLISGEDTPKISQHGFSDGKTWHCNTELWFFFWLLNLVWRCVLLLWQVYDCMKPHDGVVVIRWSLVKILQKVASMDFLMARHGIATWI